MLAQVFALVLVFVGGLVFLGLGRAASSFTFNGTTNSPAGYALALFSALWTFDGWDQANYVARDCKSGSLPTIIHASLAMVVALFVGANISYFLVLPFDVATASSTIGMLIQPRLLVCSNSGLTSLSQVSTLVVQSLAPSAA